jgi:hypothetical protein
MKIYFYLSVSASALCLVLSIVLFWVGNTNQSLQNELQTQQADLQAQQEEINKGVAIQQKLGPGLLNDMAVVSVNDDKMKQLLGKYGYSVQTPPPGSPAPGGAAPAPAPAPARTTPAPSSDSPALRP